MEYLIYKSYYKGQPLSVGENLSFEVWRPSLWNPVPKGLPQKYIIFYLFYLFRMFSNPNYLAILGHHNGKIACSLLIAPKYFKWPFMKPKDVQLIYVKTYPEFRGKGYGKKMLEYTLDYLKNINLEGDVWYVTDSENKASQALAKSVDFKQDFYGKRTYLFGIKWIKQLTIK